MHTALPTAYVSVGIYTGLLKLLGYSVSIKFHKGTFIHLFALFLLQGQVERRGPLKLVYPLRVFLLFLQA